MKFHTAITIDLTGIEPLGLALLAAFILSVAVVGVLKPRLLVVPIVLWLAVALIFGMFDSAAIRGLDLFGRPGELQPVSAYQEIVNVYLPAPPSQHPKTGEAEPLVVESPAPDPGGVESLFLDLESWDPDAVENAVISLGDLGARIIYLENGGFFDRVGLPPPFSFGRHNSTDCRARERTSVLCQRGRGHRLSPHRSG